MTSRNWCFTFFGVDGELPTPEEFINALTEPVKYVIFQEEICPETEKIHFQGYAEFTKSIRFTGAQKALNIAKAHVEKREGTQAEAIAYCSKEETRIPGTTFHEWGIKGKDTGRHEGANPVVRVSSRKSTPDPLHGLGLLCSKRLIEAIINNQRPKFIQTVDWEDIKSMYKE